MAGWIILIVAAVVGLPAWLIYKVLSAHGRIAELAARLATIEIELRRLTRTVEAKAAPTAPAEEKPIVPAERPPPMPVGRPLPQPASVTVALEKKFAVEPREAAPPKPGPPTPAINWEQFMGAKL